MTDPPELLLKHFARWTETKAPSADRELIGELLELRASTTSSSPPTGPRAR